MSRTSQLRYEQGDITRLELSMTATMASEMRNKLFQAEEEHKVAADLQRSYYDSQVREAEARVKVEKSRFFPEFSLGYQRQNILPDKGLNAYVVGASFPIFFNSQRSRIRQAKADARIARNEAEMNLRTVTNRVTGLEPRCGVTARACATTRSRRFRRPRRSSAPPSSSWPTARRALPNIS